MNATSTKSRRGELEGRAISVCDSVRSSEDLERRESRARRIEQVAQVADRSCHSLHSHTHRDFMEYSNVILVIVLELDGEMAFSIGLVS